MSADKLESLGNHASDRDSSSDDDEGFLNLPKPSAPYSMKSDESEGNDKPAETGATLESTPQLQSMLSQEESSLSMSGPLTNDMCNDSGSDTEDESQSGKQTCRESTAQTMLRLLNNQVYEYTLNKIPTGCSVTFEDTDDEFSSRAGRLDTQQALKYSTRVFKLLSEDLSKWGLKLCSGYRVHDAMNWSRYDSEREFLRHFRGAQCALDERYLFCDARPNASKNFETDLPKRKGRLGEGIYFTDSPLKAFLRASNYKVGCNATILVCRVILGDSKKYAKGQRRTDIDQRREPLKEKVDGKLVYFDSVSGRPKDFNEFVVYQNSRVFIEYVLDVSEDLATFRRRTEKMLDSN